MVISIPAVFSYHQREATIQAAKMGGLRNITLLSEPIAVVLAYISSNHDQIINKSDCNILVYDFGSGKIEVSIVHVKDKEISIIMNNGDDNLGGEDITHRLEEYITDDLKRTVRIDLSNNSKLKHRIHNECDKAKICLSMVKDIDIDVELPNDDEYTNTISRCKLNELCKDLFQRTIDIVDKTLAESNMTSKDIDYIIQIGGSSRLPQVIEYINNSFREIPICRSVNPDEAVAIGCGIYANYNLTGNYQYNVIDYIPPN